MKFVFFIIYQLIFNKSLVLSKLKIGEDVAKHFYCDKSAVDRLKEHLRYAQPDHKNKIAHKSR